MKKLLKTESALYFSIIASFVCIGSMIVESPVLLAWSFIVTIGSFTVAVITLK